MKLRHSTTETRETLLTWPFWIKFHFSLFRQFACYVTKCEHKNLRLTFRTHIIVDTNLVHEWMILFQI
jgi:hypothetical protein